MGTVIELRKKLLLIGPSELVEEAYKQLTGVKLHSFMIVNSNEAFSSNDRLTGCFVSGQAQGATVSVCNFELLPKMKFEDKEPEK